MRAEVAIIGEVKISVLQKITQGIAEIVDKTTQVFLIKQHEKNEDLLLEAKKMHIAIAKSLRQIKLKKYSNLKFQDIDIDYDMSIYLYLLCKG